MINQDYYKRSTACIKDGTATPRNTDKRYDLALYQCGKFKGICGMERCVRGHNNGGGIAGRDGRIIG